MKRLKSPGGRTARKSEPVAGVSSPHDLETIVVLAGGLSHERDVSLRSGRRVTQALRDLGHDVVESDVTGSMIELLRVVPNPVVFPLLHGGVGEDGALKEVLGLLGVPFVGSSAAASRIAFDKAVCSPRVASAGVRTPRQVALPHDMFRELGARQLVDALIERIGLPLMVKPSRSGSALGCTKVETPAQLPAAMVAAFAYGDVAVIEEFVSGTEVAVTVVEVNGKPTALPAVQIMPRSGVYDYTARYTAGETRFVCPAAVPDEVAARCAAMAIRVHEVLGLRDLSRTDMIIDAAGEPVFLETNVAPGMTETSLVPLAVEAAGFDFGRLCADLVATARARR